MGKLGIVVGGGPAPGINSVIGAATIRACLAGIEVVGIQDGFTWLAKGDTTHVVPIRIPDVSRIHFRGGSHLGISRANPTTPEALVNTVRALRELDVEMLLCIGGDGTAYCAARIAEAAEGAIRVVHVPKTIDNDIDLPHDVFTFGYQTARHVGVEIVKNLMVDAKTTSRWYFIVAMGRKAGHLAMGIGKAAGCTLTMIPEELRGKGRLAEISDTLIGSILKRLSAGRSDGVAILAEGLVDAVPPEDLEGLCELRKDSLGRTRLGEVDLATILKRDVERRLGELGLQVHIVPKNIGYEVRCADPIPFDMEYCRDLGYCAARFLIDGGSDVMVSIQADRFVPIAFSELYDTETKRMRVRMVEVDSDRYKIARAYMLRLRKEDFDDDEELTRLAKAAKLSKEAFRARFSYLVQNEERPLSMRVPAAPPSFPIS